MQKTGSEGLFPNPTTAANVDEGTKILLRERRDTGQALVFTVVWDVVRTGFHMSSGTRVENVALHFSCLLATQSPPGVGWRK